MNYEHSQTGRTTRLIERACNEAWSGRAVYILAHDSRYAKDLQSKVERTWSAMGGVIGKHGIKVENMTHWEDHNRWNWETMQPRFGGADPACLFLVDHAAIDLKMKRINKEIEYLATLAGKLYPHTV